MLWSNYPRDSGTPEWIASQRIHRYTSRATKPEGECRKTLAAWPRGGGGRHCPSYGACPAVAVLQGHCCRAWPGLQSSTRHRCNANEYQPMSINLPCPVGDVCANAGPKYLYWWCGVFADCQICHFQNERDSYTRLAWCRRAHDLGKTLKSAPCYTCSQLLHGEWMQK